MELNAEEYKRKHQVWNIANFATVESFWGIGLGLTTPSVVIAVFLAQLGASKTVIGLIPVVWGVCQAIPQALSGYFTEHLGRKKTVVTLSHFAPLSVMLAFSLYLLYYGHWSNSLTIVLFFVAYGIYALLIGFVLPLWGNFIGKVLPTARRGVGFGAMFAVTAVFSALGAEVARRILKAGCPFPEEYAYCFLLSFACCAVGNLFFLPVREAPQEDLENPQDVRLYYRELFAAILGNRDLRNLIIARIFAIGGTLVPVFYGVFARDVLQMDNAAIAGLARITFVANAAACIALGLLADRRSYKSVVLIGYGCTFGSAILLCAFARVWAVWVVAGAIGVSWAAMSVTDLNMIMRLARTERNTGFLGGVAFILSPFLAVFSILGGRVIDLAAYGMTFALAAGSMGIGMLVLAFCVTEPKENREEKTS